MVTTKSFKELTDEEKQELSVKLYLKIMTENTEIFKTGVVDMKAILHYFRNEAEGVVVYTEDNEIFGFVLVSLFKPWWSSKFLLNEESVFGFKAGFGRVALEVLEDLAKLSNASFICTGSLLMSDYKMVENLYLKKGEYLKIKPNYIKIMSS